jgi:hypothetical protein
VLKFTTEMLRNGLLRRHKPGAVARQELRIGCGYAGGADRSIDLWVIEAAATKGCPATSYEIKVSRADFQKDMKQPLKQRGARLFSDQFYFVTPPGLLRPEEIPDWAGLLEPHGANNWERWPTWREVVPAPIRSKDAPSWPLIVSMLRYEAIIVPEFEQPGAVNKVTIEEGV